MKIYKTKTKRFTGMDYDSIYSKAYEAFKKIKVKTKRRPYVRSRYFNKEKVFLELFWRHLDQKNWHDRMRRLRYFSCGVELMESSMNDPAIKQNPNCRTEVLYRFSGMTANGEKFFVQIKEDIKTKNKWLLSVFPE